MSCIVTTIIIIIISIQAQYVAIPQCLLFLHLKDSAVGASQHVNFTRVYHAGVIPVRVLPLPSAPQVS